MKRGIYKTILALFVILLFVNIGLPVRATTNSELQLTVTTEKEVYEEKEEIKYFIKLDNNYKSDVTDISVKATIPKGLEVIDTKGNISEDNITWQVNSINSGEFVELEFTLKMKESKSEDIIVDVDKPEVSTEDKDKV